MKSKKGFTLIELLVVIAIIGILASIVLVSFPGATKRAKDSRIISAIGQARTVMTYIDGNEGDYDYWVSTICTDNTNPYYEDMAALCTEITDNGGTVNIANYDSDGDGRTDKACIYSPLNATIDGQPYYCADSSGKAGGVADPTATCGGASNNGTCGF